MRSLSPLSLFRESITLITRLSVLWLGLSVFRVSASPTAFQPICLDDTSEEGLQCDQEGLAEEPINHVIWAVGHI